MLERIIKKLTDFIFKAIGVMFAILLVLVSFALILFILTMFMTAVEALFTGELWKIKYCFLGLIIGIVALMLIMDVEL